MNIEGIMRAFLELYGFIDRRWQPTKIEGVVKSRGGEPIPRATVRIGEKQAITADSGRYIFVRVPVGIVQLDLKYNDVWYENIEQIHVEAGGRYEQNLTIPHDSTLTLASSSPAVNQKAETSKLLGLMQQQMDEWRDCLDEQDENRLRWSTDHEQWFIFLYIKCNWRGKVNVCIGIMSPEPRRYRIAPTLRQLDAGDLSSITRIRSEGWAWDGSEGERYYEKNIPLHQVDGNELKILLFRWQEFLEEYGVGFCV